jgi:hypothetical protein
MKISWLAEADRQFPAARAGALRRVLKHFDGSMDWRLVSTAPFNCDVQLCASGTDRSHIVPFPCRQTEHGWINADLNVRLDIAPTEWRAWPAGQGARSEARPTALRGRSFKAPAIRRPSGVAPARPGHRGPRDVRSVAVVSL